MGLTIHYSLHADTPSGAAARKAVERLHEAAMDLPFAEVGDVVELDDALHLQEGENDEAARWLLLQSEYWIQSETGIAPVRATHVLAFRAWPGPGSEAASFGLCRYPATIELAGKTVPTNLQRWHWQSFCKTQYASNPDDGGIENFLRCHLTVIKLLDDARQLKLLAEVTDEGGFWERRDIAALVKTVGQWNRHVAAMVGRYKDWFGDDFLAPITDYPGFEHLEAEGRNEAETTSPRPGDRIRLLSMHDDPNPIEPGQMGTVVDVFHHDDWQQIDVDWDNGRALMLTSPPDRFEIIRD